MRCIRIQSCCGWGASYGQGCRVMSTVETGQTEADRPGSDEDPSDKKRTGARTARRDERKREKAAMGLSKTAVSSPRGALGASLTGRSVQECLSRDVPTDHRHTADAAVAAGEQECRSLLKENPEAKAEQEKHARIHTQADHLSRTATCEKAGQSSKPRATRV